MIPAEALTGGFADPVFDAQRAFRGMLDALSRPGRLVDLGTVAVPPAPLLSGTAAILAALADDTTPVWLDAGLMPTAVPAWIGFQTGAPTVSDPARATIAVVSDARRMPALDVFAEGSAEYPDRSTTLVLQLPALTGGAPLVLRGPGIAGTAEIAPAGLPDDFAARMASNRALFPRGVDLFLAAGSRILGLPRTVRIAEPA